MALSAERMAEFTARLAAAQQQGGATAKQPSLIESLFNPLGKMFAALPAGFEAVGDLGSAGLAKLFGGKVSAEEYIKKAQEDLTRERNFGPGGKVRPIGLDQETGKKLDAGQLAKDVGGTALEIGSYIPIASGAAKIAKLGVKGLILQGAKAGAIEGFAGGVMQGAGSELQKKSSTIGSVVAQGILSGVLGAAGGTVIGGAIPAVGAVVRKGVNAAIDNPISRGLSDIAKQAGGAVPPGGSGSTGPVGRVAEVVGEYGRKAIDAIKKAPERLAANADSIRADRMALEALPTGMRDAVDNGVLLRDAQLITEKATPAQRSFFKQMYDAARDFVANRGDKDPADVLGSAVRSKIDELQKLATEQGKQLGAFAKELGGQTVDSAKDDVLARLRSVPGLDGITIADDGTLDFAKTRLSTALTKSDRAAIQKAWNGIADKDALGIHHLRQELFSYLDGQKRSMLALTDTQDKAIQAIRQGLSDTLDDMSNGYKALNQANAELLEPLNDLRAFYKGLEGASDDILDAKSGLIGRRITSNAQTAPKIRFIFQQMDEMLEKYGKNPGVNIHKLQDFYNALSRYYDLAKDTSLAGQIKVAASDFSGGITGKMMDAVKDATGQTPAVARKAFEDLFESVMNGTFKATDDVVEDVVEDVAGAAAREGAEAVDGVVDDTIRSATGDLPPENTLTEGLPDDSNLIGSEGFQEPPTPPKPNGKRRRNKKK